LQPSDGSHRSLYSWSLLLALAASGIGALLFDYFSFGHAADMPEPMGVAGFLMEHMTYWLVAAFILFSYLGPVLLGAEDSDAV
jgi:hypothetical protein